MSWDRFPGRARPGADLAFALSLAALRERGLGSAFGAVVRVVLGTVFARVAREIARVPHGLTRLYRVGLIHSLSPDKAVFARLSARKQIIDLRWIGGFVGLVRRFRGRGVRDLVQLLAHRLGDGEARAPVVVGVAEGQTLGGRSSRRTPIGLFALDGTRRSGRLGGSDRRPRLLQHRDGGQSLGNRRGGGRESGNELLPVEPRPRKISDRIPFPLWRG